jgi:hypothetical protein
MKKASFIVVATVMLSAIQSHAFMVCKKGDVGTVNLASQHYQDSATLYNQGIFTKSDMNRANVFMLEAKLCSETISKSEFCSSVMPLLNELMSAVRQSPEERRERISLLAESKALCGL